jgi:hypothetical protein
MGVMIAVKAAATTKKMSKPRNMKVIPLIRRRFFGLGIGIPRETGTTPG